MTIEEELISLREENKSLREQLAQRDELIQQQQVVLAEQNVLLQQHDERMSRLSQQLQALQNRLAKDSHNSHLPPLLGSVCAQTEKLAPQEREEIWRASRPPGSELAVLCDAR